MVVTLGLSQPVMELFDEKDKKEFILVNNFFWNRSELLYIQENEVDVHHLLYVYDQYLTHLQRCIELLETIRPMNDF
jgi:hypothetical protein